MEITVTMRSVYGENRIYPVCEKAKTFAALAGSITLSERAIKHIKSLGYVIIVQSNGPATL